MITDKQRQRDYEYEADYQSKSRYTTEQWTNILNSGQLDEKNISLLKQIYSSFNHAATLLQLSFESGRTQEDILSQLNSAGQLLGEANSMNPEVDYEGNEYWWYLFFWGKNTDAKTLELKMHPELTEAIGTLYPELEESYYAFMSDVERSLQTRYSQEDAVWIAAAVLLYEKYYCNPGISSDDILLMQYEVQTRSQKVYGQDVNANTITQICNADERGHRFNYLRDIYKYYRVSFPGEFEGERERQIELLEMGRSVVQETRRWDDNKESSHAMRSKEDAKDYRYFPDPDLPPIHISDEWIQKIREELPEFREEKAARYQEEFGLPEYDSRILTESRHLAALFEDVATLSGNPKKAANWFMVEVLRLMKEKGIEAEKLRFTPQHLADLLTMVDKKEVSPQNAKKVFEKVFDEDVDPVAYVEEHGLKIVEDTGLLSSTISRILDENPGPLSELLGGKEKVMGFFVGQIMKEMKGKANPASVREALLAEVEKRK